MLTTRRWCGELRRTWDVVRASGNLALEPLAVSKCADTNLLAIVKLRMDTGKKMLGRMNPHVASNAQQRRDVTHEVEHLGFLPCTWMIARTT